MAELPAERGEDRDVEPIEQISGDLPYELQSKMFDQLAALGLGGAGLAITLAGSILRGAPLIWIVVIEFGLAAFVALVAQQHLIEGLFRRRPTRRRSRLLTALSVLLIGMAVGSLATSSYLQSREGAQPERAVARGD